MWADITGAKDAGMTAILKRGGSANGDTVLVDPEVDVAVRPDYEIDAISDLLDLPIFRP